MRPYGRQEGNRRPLSLGVNEAPTSSVPWKVHLKHTINFPIADVTFYCPVGPAFLQVGRPRCAAFYSQIDASVCDGDVETIFCGFNLPK